ncbi:MAG: HIRAN domain-containing protein [Alphaproteobacteria bacterium]|nr:HIRAN domain-containing protein [Alphaproteobacteria bacterium]MBU2083943.1 HIRAN domain-containing protein [Alphaproteobacteria bacterium]MBU2142295.1 HIRAN domain-containing protein [Alphaproteobacteria bacterium]MBU2196493.1 HIRAN domain-containing protein [Alphaproteobacteria bacterium]
MRSGRLASDSFSFAETFDGFDGPFRFIFDVAGYRRREPDHEGLTVGERVNFVAEPTNGFDPHAVQIQRQNGAKLGYVSSLQSARVAGWLRDGAIEVEIFRIDGRPIYPRLFVLADVSPHRGRAGRLKTLQSCVGRVLLMRSALCVFSCSAPKKPDCFYFAFRN